MSIRHLGSSTTLLVSTVFLACSSSTPADRKDAADHHDAVSSETTALRDALPLDTTAVHADLAMSPDLAPASAEAGTDADARTPSDSPPAPSDTASGSLETSLADTGRPDARDTGTTDAPSAPDARLDVLPPFDQARDVPYLPDGNPADVRDGVDAVAIDGPAVGCNPVAPGAPVSFPVSGGLSRLIPDPSACLVYGLGPRDITEIVVLDSAQKTVLTRVPLGGVATDVSLSPNGKFLVASLRQSQAIAVVNKASWTVSLVSTPVAPGAIAVDSNGIAYYMGEDLHRIDLALGSPSDKRLTTAQYYYGAVIELAADGKRLYVAEYGSMGSNLYLLDVTASSATVVSHTTWDYNYGFDKPSGRLSVGPNGKHVYYADHQFDANNLALILGSASGVYAEDSGARFAVGWGGIADAQTLTMLISMPYRIYAAAFVAGDTELWTYSLDAGTVTCTNVADLAPGQTLGLREGTASAIGDYSFSKLIADPVRPRLYGLDAAQRMVVSIDRATGAALRTVLVGSTPTDVEIDASGTFIYAGHADTYAIAQIDAVSLAFVKYIPSPQDSYDVAPLGKNRIASIDQSQWTVPALIDLGTGKVLQARDERYEAALFATADGSALFVAESGLTASNIYRFDVSGGDFTSVTTSFFAAQGYYSPARRVVGTPDGTSVFYAGYCLDGSNLRVQRYAQPDAILSVAPNGVLAVSSAKVYRVADGTALATLPAACPVQAVSLDSSTLYCVGTSGITTFSLAGLQ